VTYEDPPPEGGYPTPPAHAEPEWKRQARHREKVVALVMAPLLLALIIAGAIGGADEDDEAIAAVGTTSDPSDAPSSGDPSCVVLVGNGMKDTEQVLADLEQPCLDEDGELITVRTESYTCLDGSVLHVNDFGRGNDSSAWRPDDFAPDDFEIERCTGGTTTTTEPPTTATTAPPTTTTTAPPTTTTTAPPENPEVSNARRAAQQYLDYSGFSRSGLIEQLEYEGYSTEAATTVVDSLNVDWMAEAVESAQAYVEYSPFSHSGLVEQLQYEGFSPEEAEHGATTALGG
jgi:hypothetical protein